MLKDYQNLKTPAYIVDLKKYKNNISVVIESFKNNWSGPMIFGYSVKTNHKEWFIKHLGDFYAEVVSGDELNYVIEKGVDPTKIIFNGPQKKEDDIRYFLYNGGILNIDNFNDISLIEKIINTNCNLSKHLKIGIRVNFDLERYCPKETTAGSEVSRFGICFENGDLQKVIDKLHRLRIPVSGLHLHYSTKTRSKKVFFMLAHTAVKIVEKYNLKNEIEFIDMGGGFFGGQRNDIYPTFEEYSSIICSEIKKISNSISLIIEPGASILATAVEYIAKVIDLKFIRNVGVVTTDGSILHVNPFMIERNYTMEVLHSNIDLKSEIVEKQIICGATCMEKDRFLTLNNEQKIKNGDLIKVSFTGAYTMAFNSCFINLPPYVYQSNSGKFTLIYEANKNLMTLI